MAGAVAESTLRDVGDHFMKVANLFGQTGAYPALANTLWLLGASSGTGQRLHKE